MQLVNKDLFQAQFIYSAKQSLAWGIICRRVWCRHCPPKHCSCRFPSGKELLSPWQGCTGIQSGTLSGLQQSGLAKEAHQGSARDAAVHLFCISFFLFHTIKAKWYEAFPPAPLPASKAKGNFICIRNPTQMNQAMFFLPTSWAGNLGAPRSKKKACPLLENIDMLRKTATHVE